MTKAFKKGQKVTVISSWCRGYLRQDGTYGTPSVTYRQATIYSCGVKRMKLTCDVTGVEFGTDYQPYNATRDGARVLATINVYERMSDDDTITEALRLSEAKRQDNIEGCVKRIAAFPTQKSYIAAMTAFKDHLETTPAIALDYHAAVAKL